MTETVLGELRMVTAAGEVGGLLRELQKVCRVHCQGSPGWGEDSARTEGGQDMCLAPGLSVFLRWNSSRRAKGSKRPAHLGDEVVCGSGKEESLSSPHLLPGGLFEIKQRMWKRRGVGTQSLSDQGISPDAAHVVRVADPNCSFPGSA